MAQIAWREAPWPLVMTNFPSLGIAEWMCIMLKPAQLLNLPFDQQINFSRFAAILMDSIWFARNRIIHKGGSLIISQLLTTIHSRFQELLAAWSEKSSKPLPVWKPPPWNTWKINFDIASRKSFAFAAVVCRNSEGHIIFARTKRLPPYGPLVREARAALFAAQEAFLLPFHSIILEGDSLLAIEAINNGGTRGD